MEKSKPHRALSTETDAEHRARKIRRRRQFQGYHPTGRSDAAKGRRTRPRACFSSTAVFLEVFVNERQCLTQRLYPARKDSIGVKLFTRDGEMTVKLLEAWKMMPVF